jgi:hypothetical protein
MIPHSSFRPSDDDIPKVVQLVYTPHATRARFDDQIGIVKTVPASWRREGCKSFKKHADGNYHVSYIYDNDTDLVLVINVINGIGHVITLWFDRANNQYKNRGRYFLMQPKFEKSRSIVERMAVCS